MRSEQPTYVGLSKVAGAVTITAEAPLGLKGTNSPTSGVVVSGIAQIQATGLNSTAPGPKASVAAVADHTMTAITIADSTGRITMSALLPAFMVPIQDVPVGGSVVLGTGNWKTQYVNNGQIVDRPANTTTLSGMQLSNVPNPSSVTIGTASAETVTDGEVEISITQPGTYAVSVSSWPMLDANFTVTQS